MVIYVRLPDLLQTPNFPSGLKYTGHLRESAKKSSANATSWDILSGLGYMREELFTNILHINGIYFFFFFF